MDATAKESELDAFIGRFFSAFDNREGRVPTCRQIADFFLERAVILTHAGDNTTVMTVTEFAEPRVALLTSGGLREFSEWEVAGTTQLFGAFAIRVSEYAKSGVMESRPYQGEGTKLFQLVQAGGRWQIASLCWYDRDANKPRQRRFSR